MNRGIYFQNGQFSDIDLDAELGEWKDGVDVEDWLKASGFHSFADDGRSVNADVEWMRRYWGHADHWSDESGERTLTVLYDTDASEMILTKTSSDFLLLRRWLREYLCGPQIAEAMRTMLQLSERQFRHRFEHDPEEPCQECETYSERRERLNRKKIAVG